MQASGLIHAWETLPCSLTAGGKHPLSRHGMFGSGIMTANPLEISQCDHEAITSDPITVWKAH